MKIVTVLLSLMMAGSAFADSDFLTEGEFKGKGMWRDTDGGKGRYEMTLQITPAVAAKDDDKSQEYTVTKSIQIFQKDQLLRTEEHARTWRISEQGRLSILDEDKEIGKGFCMYHICIYKYTEMEGEDEAYGREILRFHPKKGLIQVVGGWKSDDSTGGYRGVVCNEDCDKMKDKKDRRGKKGKKECKEKHKDLEAEEVIEETVD